MVGKYRIIDGHVHTFASEAIALKIIEAFNKVYAIEFENPGNGSIGDVLTNMEKGNVDYTVMTNFAPPKILHTNNLWTLDVAKEHPCLIPLVSFHPEMEGNMSELLEEYIGAGAKGIKIHPMAQAFSPDHPAMQNVYRYCGEISFPIVFHCGRVANARLNAYADIDRILPVIEKYPEVPFVLTHMVDGSMEDVIRLSKEFDNVYFDTSIVITGYPSLMNTNKPSWLDDDMVVDVINTVGAEKVIFGSDYPWGSPLHDIPRIMNMQLSDEQKELIFAGNAVKLYKLSV